LKGRRGQQLPSPFFVFVLLQEEEEEGEDNFVVVAFFFGFFGKAEGDDSCRPLLFVLFCYSKKKKALIALLPLPSSLRFF
jgi:hypothetical protein